MVLILELVSIGVFGACLSAFLCIIAEGKFRKVSEIVEEGLLRTRFINPQKWTIASTSRIEETKRNLDQITNKIKSNDDQKPCPEYQKDFDQNQDIFNRNLNLNRDMTAVKLNDNVKEEYLTNENLGASGNTIGKACKYCGDLNVPNSKFNRRKNSKNESIVNKSDGNVKCPLPNDKSDEDTCTECKRLYNKKWRKVRTKKIKFIMPKSLVIDSKRRHHVVAHNKLPFADFWEDTNDGELEFDGRHCYLEALRIKINKVEKSV